MQTEIIFPYIKDGGTYPIQTDYLTYGGTAYTKPFAMIDGKKQYLTKEYTMNDRNGYPKYFMVKDSFQEQKDHLYSPIISRLAEMYLIRAEINGKRGNTAAALEDVNLTRTRANTPKFTELTTGKNGFGYCNGRKIVGICL